MPCRSDNINFHQIKWSFHFLHILCVFGPKPKNKNRWKKTSLSTICHSIKNSLTVFRIYRCYQLKHGIVNSLLVLFFSFNYLCAFSCRNWTLFFSCPGFLEVLVCLVFLEIMNYSKRMVLYLDRWTVGRCFFFQEKFRKFSEQSKLKKAFRLAIKNWRLHNNNQLKRA
jgi:hypothetical protein